MLCRCHINKQYIVMQATRRIYIVLCVGHCTQGKMIAERTFASLFVRRFKKDNAQCRAVKVREAHTIVGDRPRQDVPHIPLFVCGFLMVINIQNVLLPPICIEMMVGDRTNSKPWTCRTCPRFVNICQLVSGSSISLVQTFMRSLKFTSGIADTLKYIRKQLS